MIKEILKKIIIENFEQVPPSCSQNSLSSLPSDINGAFPGANLLDASLASPVLLLPHQTTGEFEKSMKTPIESKLLALNGRSTALDVYGVEPNTLTKYLRGAG